MLVMTPGFCIFMGVCFCTCKDTLLMLNFIVAKIALFPNATILLSRFLQNNCIVSNYKNLYCIFRLKSLPLPSWSIIQAFHARYCRPHSYSVAVRKLKCHRCFEKSSLCIKAGLKLACRPQLSSWFQSKAKISRLANIFAGLKYAAKAV